MSKKKILAAILAILVIVAAIVVGLNFNNWFHKSNVEPETIDENKVIENIPSKVEDLPQGLSIESEETLEKEGFEEANPDIIAGASQKTAEEDGWIVGAKQSQPVYYSQIDGRWSSHPYTITGNSSQTIGTSGCGPTSAAMIVSTIKGTVIPPDMGDLFVRNGFRTTNNGTYFSAFPFVARYFGLEMEQVNSTYAMADKVANGYIAVVSCSEGLWTTGGHFITVMGNNNGILKVFDPYLYSGKFNTSSRRGAGVRVEGNAAYVTVDNFYRYSNAKAFWCYKWKDGSEPVTPDTPKPTPETGTTKYVKVNTSLNVRNAPNGTWIGSLYNGDQVTVYETSSNWSRIGDSRWVCSDYLVDSKPGSSTPSQSYSNWTGYTTAKSGLNIRRTPNGTIIGGYSYNTKVTIIGESGDWLQTNKGWIYKSYVSKSSSSSSSSPKSGYVLGRYKTQVSSVLNIRSGPGTNYRIKRTYRNGTVFDTYEIKGEWARTPSGWVNLRYAKLMYRY